MHDAERVCFGERLAYLQHVTNRDLGAERPVAVDQCVEIDALEVLHHQVGSP